MEVEYLSLSMARVASYMAIEALVMNQAMSRIIPYHLMKTLKSHCPFTRKFMRSYGLERSLSRLAVKL